MRKIIGLAPAAVLLVGCSGQDAPVAAPGEDASAPPGVTMAPRAVTPTPTAASTANFPNHADGPQDIIDALDAAGIECEYGWTDSPLGGDYEQVCGTGPAKMVISWDPLAPEKQDLLDTKERSYTTLYTKRGGGFVRGSNWILGYDADHAEGMPKGARP